MVWPICRRKQGGEIKMVHGTIYATGRARLRYDHQKGGLLEWSQRRQFAFLGTRSVAGCRL